MFSRDAMLTAEGAQRSEDGTRRQHEREERRAGATTMRKDPRTMRGLL